MKPYYQDDHAVIYHGDCREILPALPKVDLLLSDPPYEMQAKGGGIGARRQYLAQIHGKLDRGFDVSMLDQFESWAVFCGKSQLKSLLSATGDRVWSLVTWNKPNPTPLCGGNYLPDTEYIVHAYKSGRLFGEYSDKSRFIVHPVEKNEYTHPTVKPIAVISKMVRLGSAIGETILDPFCGTGTTLLAAKQLGRHSIGIEIEEKWCQVAAERLQQEYLPLVTTQTPKQEQTALL